MQPLISIRDLVQHLNSEKGLYQLQGDGAQARVQVQFDAVGSKWLVLSFANLTKMG